jgi:hypothetical protein
MGLGSAITASANKIINGEDWNMRDIRNVLNGLNGFLTLKKTGLFKGGKSKITSGEIDVKIKGKPTKEKLTKTELAEIQSKTGEDVNKTIREIIVKKYPKRKLKADDIDLSPAKIEEKIGLKF